MHLDHQKDGQRTQNIEGKITALLLRRQRSGVGFYRLRCRRRPYRFKQNHWALAASYLCVMALAGAGHFLDVGSNTRRKIRSQADQLAIPAHEESPGLACDWHENQKEWDSLDACRQLQPLELRERQNRKRLLAPISPPRLWHVPGRDDSVCRFNRIMPRRARGDNPMACTEQWLPSAERPSMSEWPHHRGYR